MWLLPPCDVIPTWKIGPQQTTNNKRHPLSAPHMENL